MPVVGMGGYFFRAKNPEAVKAWYREHLGIGGGVGGFARVHDPEGNPVELWEPVAG